MTLDSSERPMARDTANAAEPTPTRDQSALSPSGTTPVIRRRARPREGATKSHRSIGAVFGRVQAWRNTISEIQRPRGEQPGRRRCEASSDPAPMRLSPRRWLTVADPAMLLSDPSDCAPTPPCNGHRVAEITCRCFDSDRARGRRVVIALTGAIGRSTPFRRAGDWKACRYADAQLTAATRLDAIVPDIAPGTDGFEKHLKKYSANTGPRDRQTPVPRS